MAVSVLCVILAVPWVGLCLILAVPRVGLQCVIVSFSGHTHLLNIIDNMVALIAKQNQFCNRRNAAGIYWSAYIVSIQFKAIRIASQIKRAFPVKSVLS